MNKIIFEDDYFLDGEVQLIGMEPSQVEELMYIGLQNAGSGHASDVSAAAVIFPATRVVNEATPLGRDLVGHISYRTVLALTYRTTTPHSLYFPTRCWQRP